MLLLRLGLLCGWLLAAASALAVDAPPVAVIERLHAELIETMKSASRVDVDGRYRQLEPTLLASFDFPRMISAAAGSHWATASEADKQRLLQAFSRLSIMTYAARFNGYSGERFETLGERTGPRETVLVDTQLIRTDGPPVPLTYVMAERDGRWQIVDILLERSISELAVRRSEYNQILRNGGTEELAATLDRKTAELREE